MDNKNKLIDSVKYFATTKNTTKTDIFNIDTAFTDYVKELVKDENEKPFVTTLLRFMREVREELNKNEYKLYPYFIESIKDLENNGRISFVARHSYIDGQIFKINLKEFSVSEDVQSLYDYFREDERTRYNECLSNAIRLIKSNVFYNNLNGDGLTDFRMLSRIISGSFYHSIKNDKNYFNVYNNSGMIHDFNASIGSGYFDHVFRCFNIIEKYLDTGIFDEFYTYYTGANILPFMDRLSLHVLVNHKEKGKAFVPAYATDNRINEYISILENDVNNDVASESKKEMYLKWFNELKVNVIKV